MSRHNYIDDLEYSQANGMDTTSPVSMIQPGFLQDARNCDIGLYGGYSKRNGYVNQATSVWTGRSITAGIEYKDSGGGLHIALYGVNGSDGRIGLFSGGAVTEIISGLSGTARTSFIQFGSLLFFYNGVDTPQVYDGTSWYQNGITAPISAPTISSQTTGGSLTQGASYVYTYTYFNSVTFAESSPSPATSPTLLTGANNKIVLGLTPGSSATADTIRIWRTDGNGNQLFLDGTAAISATTYNSTIADSGLTTAMETDNTRITQLTTLAQYPAVVTNRVFLKVGPNTVRASKIGQSGPMPQSFEVKQIANTVGTFGNNDDIVGINSAYGIPIILKQRSIGTLTPAGIPNSTSSIDNVIYNYSELSANIGAVSHWAATQVEGMLVFLAHDNVYATDGQRIWPLADAISATISSLGFVSDQAVQISCENNTRDKQVLFSVFLNGTSTTPAYVLVGDYKHWQATNAFSLPPQFKWTWYTPGPNIITWPGIQAGCMFSVTNASDGGRDIWFGNINSNGKVYLLNSGTTDDGSGIYFKIISRPYDMKKPLNPKLYADTGVHVQGNGSNYNLTMYAIYDLSGSEQDVQSVNLKGTGATWDVSNWDSANWVDLAVAIQKYSAHHVAKFMQIVYYQTDASAPLSLLGWGSTASLYQVS